MRSAATHTASPATSPATSLVSETSCLVMRSPRSTHTHARRHRRSTARFVHVLLGKNALLKRRQYVTTALEIVFPSLFILLMGFLKHQSDDVRVPTGWSDNAPAASDDACASATTRYSINSSMNGSAFNATMTATANVPGSCYNLYTPYGSFIPWVLTELPKFTMYESTLTGLLLALAHESVFGNAGDSRDGLEALRSVLPPSQLAACVHGVAVLGAVLLNASSPHHVSDACAGHVRPAKLAIAPDTPFTREYFLQTMDTWYPRVTLGGSTTNSATRDSTPVLHVPSFRESVVFYKTAADLEAYVQSREYDTSNRSPRIYGAIVFDVLPNDTAIGTFSSIEYTLRLNSTRGRHDIQGRVPRTIDDPPALSPFQRGIKTDFYSRYAVTGFMTLQTLVTRFVT